jgi:hypothetical protein
MVSREMDMAKKRVVLITGAVVALVGLVLLKPRLAPAQESFFRSEIWLPHQSLGQGYNLALPFEGPIPGEKVSLDEARSRMPFPIPLPSYMPGSTKVMEVYASRADTATEFRQAALVYENGIYIILHVEEEITLGWETPLADQPDIFKPVEINGHPGLGAEPGLARECVTYAPSTDRQCTDGPGRRPGFVEWQVGRVVIYIASYDYPLAELLRVAESMEVR